MAIDCDGIVAQLQVDYALDHVLFMEMLDNIAGATKIEKIYLFMDNAKYHKNELV